MHKQDGQRVRGDRPSVPKKRGSKRDEARRALPDLSLRPSKPRRAPVESDAHRAAGKRRVPPAAQGRQLRIKPGRRGNAMEGPDLRVPDELLDHAAMEPDISIPEQDVKPDDFGLEAFPEPKPSGARRARRRDHARSRYGQSKKRVRPVWWAMPIAVAMSAVLVLLGSFLVVEIRGYAQFITKKNSVSRATFYPGVTLDGVDLSTMTLEDALSEWSAREQKVRESFNLTLKLDGQDFPVDAEAMGYSSDWEQVLHGAWSIGRYGTLDERYRVVSSLRQEDWRRDFEVSRTMDDAVALKTLGGIAASLSTPPVNATVDSFDEVNRTFTFTDSSPGLMVDENELLLSVKGAFANGKETVNIVRREVMPQDTKESLSETYGSIASASTDASFSTANRLTNLRVACKVLNGLRIEPGETFSFNKTLGKRTAKKGYKPAAAYENGVTTNQLGGGICQVSTTLFNAVAKADMKIVERSPHSRPSSYIGIGKDAAVNWPNQDLKFTNTSDYPIYLTARLTDKKKVNIAVYGKKLPGGITIEIKSEKTNTYPAGASQVTRDPKLLPGEKVVVENARNGYTAVAYRVYKDASGNEIKTVQLAKSYYPPAGAIVRVGE